MTANVTVDARTHLLTEARGHLAADLGPGVASAIVALSLVLEPVVGGASSVALSFVGLLMLAVSVLSSLQRAFFRGCVAFDHPRNGCSRCGNDDDSNHAHTDDELALCACRALSLYALARIRTYST